MANVKVYWFDDEIACIDCLCGQSPEMIVHANPYTGDTFDRCDKCGRGYRVVQRVEVVEPDLSGG